VLQFKSPAEFFAENQNIAGFDNAGKALYTTIREFVENGLDAAESAGRLPDISLVIEEMDAPTFNKFRAAAHAGAGGAEAVGEARRAAAAAPAAAAGGGGRKRARARADADAAEGDTARGERGRAGRGGGRGGRSDDDGVDGGGDGDGGDGGGEGEGKAGKGGKRGGGGGGGGKREEVSYYRLTCRDNGCGMPHEKIPDMLGRVLSGSKYGVRQTRGKFGLGAKMALIWSKKSTGLPIEVTTAYGAAARRGSGGGGSGGPASQASIVSVEGEDGKAAPAASSAGAPARVSYCKLDIDIYKNVPHVLAHTARDNAEGWVGTEISAVISGSWGAYRSRIMHYFQQLAVITPYAQFELAYANLSTGATARGDFSYLWRRRSSQIPRPPTEVKHHPSAVNDLLIAQLIDGAKCRASTATLAGFLTSQFQCVDRRTAADIIDTLPGRDLAADTPIASLSAKDIHAVRVAMEAATYPPPSGDCLSPAGEYNLRLGIMKEVRPDLVATASSPVQVFQGHPFIVEAGVALGGRGAEGLTVHRFANRIPLLFEAGGDVATQTATKRIPWATYKIDIARDKVGVFVSLVSTKIPFKGTGKEYIGDDIAEIREAVRGALQACCSQLRVKLLRASALRARANRRKTLVKYVPDVTRALLASLAAFTARGAGTKRARDDGDGDAAAAPDPAAGSARWTPARVMHEFGAGRLGDKALRDALMAAVEKADMEAALEQASAVSAGVVGLEGEGGDGGGGGGGGGLPLAIGPLSQHTFRGLADLHGAAFVLKLLPAAMAPLATALPTRAPVPLLLAPPRATAAAHAAATDGDGDDDDDDL